MKIVVISDTHGRHEELLMPDGDVLIHAGDFTRYGAEEDVCLFNEFLGSLPHKHKIVIAGNHDSCLEQVPEQAEKLLTNATYLKDNSIVIDGIKFYGSPWQPWFFDWSFNLQRGTEIKEKWALIDEDTDVLITHGPPQGYCDRVREGENVGCADLLEVVELIMPRLHIFGHIHEGYGLAGNGQTTFINASSCDYYYQVTNPPVVIEI
jgi:Icc-related predicted phosphoesterase